MATSFNSRLKEYWLDVAGQSTILFGRADINFDDAGERMFDTSANHSLNDAMRIGLQHLGYGGLLIWFNRCHDNFDMLGSHFERDTRSLNYMLRAWAQDQVTGRTEDEFGEIDAPFDGIFSLFGTTVVSINTAFQAALTATAMPDEVFSRLNYKFSLIINTFDAITVGKAISAALEEFVGYTFGLASLEAFGQLGMDFEDVHSAFDLDVENDTRVLTTYDRERRMFNYIDHA